MSKFELNEVEQKAAKQFEKSHCLNCPKYNEVMQANIFTIGGEIQYIFTPTGIGTVIIIRCVCGFEENITDYSCW